MRTRRILQISAAIAALAGVSAQAREERTFAVSYFYTASYAEDGDCPNGLNPSTAQVWMSGMRALDLPEEKVEAFFAGSKSMKEEERNQIYMDYIGGRGRIDGKSVNIYANPLARPYLTEEPKLFTTVSKFGYGFNLDGKCASSPTGFEDPETHEKGVNNEYYRVMSCVQSFRAKPPFRASANAMHSGSSYSWVTARPMMPAWLFTISGEDFSKDGDVTVSFFRSLDRVNIDGKSDPMAHDTFRFDPDLPPNTFKGKIEGGVVTVQPLANFYMKADQYIYPEVRLRNAHFRVVLKPDGKADSVLGGYQPWMDIYGSMALPGAGNETGNALDTATFYVMLKKHAEASPDPKTGQNTEISAAYRIEAIPAYVVDAE